MEIFVDIALPPSSSPPIQASIEFKVGKSVAGADFVQFFATNCGSSEVCTEAAQFHSLEAGESPTFFSTCTTGDDSVPCELTSNSSIKFCISDVEASQIKGGRYQQSNDLPTEGCCQFAPGATILVNVLESVATMTGKLAVTCNSPLLAEDQIQLLNGNAFAQFEGPGYNGDQVWNLNGLPGGDDLQYSVGGGTCENRLECISGACAGGGSNGSNGTSDNPCFHESTIVTYGGREYSMLQLQQRMHQDCVVPHVVYKRNGVIVETETKHSLQLTGDHLVWANGHQWKAAVQLTTSDTLTLRNGQQVKVSNVKTVRGKERYFGLNCLQSTVFANEIKTSTFGTFHHIPATWMRIAGNMLGIEKASKIGDFFAVQYWKVASKVRKMF